MQRTLVQFARHLIETSLQRALIIFSDPRMYVPLCHPLALVSNQTLPALAYPAPVTAPIATNATYDSH
jgi:hypothetical protein